MSASAWRLRPDTTQAQHALRTRVALTRVFPYLSPTANQGVDIVEHGLQIGDVRDK